MLSYYHAETGKFILPHEIKELLNIMLCLYILGLVVLTSMAGYVMAPGMFDPMTFLFATVGTALTSASANATNQVQHFCFNQAVT